MSMATEKRERYATVHFPADSWWIFSPLGPLALHFTLAAEWCHRMVVRLGTYEDVRMAAVNPIPVDLFGDPSLTGGAK